MGCNFYQVAAHFVLYSTVSTISTVQNKYYLMKILFCEANPIDVKECAIVLHART